MDNDNSVFAQNTQNTLFYWCPGCETLHAVYHKEFPNPMTGATWTWNNDFVNPTVEPSILCRQGTEYVCHHFIRSGFIEYCTDTYHKLAGQKVRMLSRPLDRY